MIFTCHRECSHPSTSTTTFNSFILVLNNIIHSSISTTTPINIATNIFCHFCATIQLIDKQYLNQFHTHLLFTSQPKINFYYIQIIFRQFEMAITSGKTISLYYYDFTDFVPDYPEYA
ncbi:hypothetical protein BLOT_014996, partial [Blomia tropicalis]